MIKVFTVNENGKIEFTKAELEKLLNETHSEGYKEGKYDSQQNWAWTSPSLNGVSTTPYNGPITYCNSAVHPKTTNISASNDEDIKALDNSKAIDVNLAVEEKPFVYKVTSSDIDAISKAVDEMLTNARNSFCNPGINDANTAPLETFDALAKELIF